MSSWIIDSTSILIALALVVVNGFFVAAEFALVKVRGSQLDELVRRRRPFAKTAQWLAHRLDASLSACQLGITMASLGLGWVGEPAFARILESPLHSLGIQSAALLHTIAFVIAFSVITILHLVIGEQAPKIFAIRRADRMALWCAPPLKVFYVLSYPLLIGLNSATAFLLGLVGVKGASGEETPHTEDEIKTLLSDAHAAGTLTRSEHHLLNAIFEFDDTVCRRVMVPRGEVVFLDLDHTLNKSLSVIHKTKHTRYPVCRDSLDTVLGVLHIKDLVGLDPDGKVDLKKYSRPPASFRRRCWSASCYGTFRPPTSCWRSWWTNTGLLWE